LHDRKTGRSGSGGVGGIQGIEDFAAAMADWQTPAIGEAKAKAIVRAWESGEIQRQTRVHRLVRDAPIQASIEV
jgi:hypothetical protein